MMELEGIDMMFSDLKITPMSVKEYQEYMKERKREAKGSKQKLQCLYNTNIAVLW